jgi:hypothetical protein
MRTCRAPGTDGDGGQHVVQARRQAAVRHHRDARAPRRHGQLELLLHDVGVAAEVAEGDARPDRRPRERRVEPVGQRADRGVVATQQRGCLPPLERLADRLDVDPRRQPGQPRHRGGEAPPVRLHERERARFPVAREIVGDGDSLAPRPEDRIAHREVLP